MIEEAHTIPPETPPPGTAANGADPDAHPARALTLHLLRMLETRMDAAGIALTTEVQGFSTRLQLKLLAAATLFIAIWGGIVLLAIALPERRGGVRHHRSLGVRRVEAPRACRRRRLAALVHRRPEARSRGAVAQPASPAGAGPHRTTEPAQ
jgi:hypothetical protein